MYLTLTARWRYLLLALISVSVLLDAQRPPVAARTAKPAMPIITMPQPAAQASAPAPSPAVQPAPQKPIAPAIQPVAPAAPVKPAVTTSAPQQPAPASRPISAPAIQPAPQVPAVAPAPISVPATAPEAPKPVAPVAEEAAPGPVASEEFDTSKIKEYGGNWYFKRAWWQNAEGEYEKARQVLEQLFEARMAFFEKRNELQRTLFEPFYRNMGFQQGELQDTLVYLIDQIEGARATEGTLDIQQREFLTLLEEQKKTLEQLKLDIDQLSKFDDAINQALDLLMKQINQAHLYEQTAWKEFKAIAEDLSDIKARERYYTIKTLYKDIKNISEYIRGDFKKYFDNLADVSHKEADRIKGTVQELKSKGIDLKIEAKKLAEEPVKKPATSAEAGEQPGYIMSAVYWVGDALKSTWNLVFGWIYRF